MRVVGHKKHFLCLAVHSCVKDAHKPDKKAYLSKTSSVDINHYKTLHLKSIDPDQLASEKTTLYTLLVNAR